MPRCRPSNVTQEESVREAIDKAVDVYGRLDILFNCAGGSTADDGTVTEVDMAVWDHTISLDLQGTFLCCRHGVPRLMEAGGGSVVNMSSVAGLQGVPTHVYVAAKGGVIAFTRSLAGSYAGDGIRASAICPGLVLTERVKQRLGAGSDSPKAVAQAAAVDAQGRKYPFSVGQPDDIAQVALFLASDESRMITGAVIPADGGMTAY